MTIPWQEIQEYENWLKESADTASAATKEIVEYERVCWFRLREDKSKFMEWYDNWLLPHGKQRAD